MAEILNINEIQNILAGCPTILEYTVLFTLYHT